MHMRRFVELSRYVVILPAFGSLLGAFVLMLIGVWEVFSSIWGIFNSSSPLKDTVVGILTAVDTLLLATVLLVIGYGLYELFVDSEVQLPPWLEIRDLDDLKNKLIGVVVAIIAVVFLGQLVDNNSSNEVFLAGAGSGALVLGLAAFTYATKKTKSPIG
jgi:uncharacterized membrane protein YqhA